MLAATKKIEAFFFTEGRHKSARRKHMRMTGRLLVFILWLIITELFDDPESEIKLFKSFLERCPMECKSWKP